MTYINSAASLKAFCGRHGGIVCTSSNAAAVLAWSFARRRRVLFFPDQHLGRNTAKAMGVALDEMPVWDPTADDLGGNTAAQLERSRVLLWKGHCSVHAMFRSEHVDLFRAKFPGIRVLVHPECAMEVVDKADVSGSTGKIIEVVRNRLAGGTAMGDRHRTAPGQSAEARTSGAADSLPVAGGLHVRDNVSDRSGPSGLEPGTSGRRQAGECDPRRRRDRPLGPGWRWSGC